MNSYRIPDKPRIALSKLVVLALVLALPSPATVTAQGSAEPGVIVIHGAERSAPVTPFVFLGDLRDVPAAPQWRPGDPVIEIPRRFYPEPGTGVVPDYEPGIDPLLQAQLDQLTSGRGIDEITVPSRNFPGQGYTGVNPPDTVGDVGPSHYIQMVNSGGGALVAVYDKAEPTPNLLTPVFSLDTLGSGSCASGYGDPIVLYDRLADRWMLSEFSSSGNNLCVYVSQTGDPVSGGWYAYAFTAPSFPDYPKYGVWPTDANDGQGSYVVTANDGGPGIYALDRGAMLAGNPATYQRVSIPNLPGFSFEAPTPADLDGAEPPANGEPAIIMRHRDTENHSGPPAPGDLLEMWTFDVDWNNAANSVLTTMPSIDVAEFDSDLCGLTAFFCFPQPDSSTTLDPLREVIMNRLQYMNFNGRETLVGNFVTDVDGNDHGGIRWFELEKVAGVWTLHQEGTYAIDADHRWMGSSAMDQSGNIAVGYNISSTTTYPSLRFTGRLVDDPLGVMTVPETVIHAGTSPNSSNRYGDYAAMNLDPVDDCTFWFTGMDNTSTSWRTQIASFGFEACGCDLAPDPPATSAVANGDNQIDITWDDANLDTVVEYLVRRSRTPGGPYQTIATVPDTSPGVAGGPGYLYQDTDVSGTITYYYVVVASDGVSCRSALTNEVSETGLGPCTLPPLFEGVQTVTTPLSPTCSLEITWIDGTPECAGPLLYDVYRSTAPGFTPNPGNLVVSGVSGTVITDSNSLVSGDPYYYIVRAVDQSNAATETNVVEASGVPLGPVETGTFFDDAGDSGVAQMSASSPWSIDPAEGYTGPAVYKTGTYSNNACSGLSTPELRLSAGAQLTFWSKYEIENSWDKGEVQISSDGGQTWQRLEVGYPGTSTNTSDACGLPTGTYFTGTNLTWAQYSADLSAWEDQDVIVRFALSTDGSVVRTGWWIDDITITQAGVPGVCQTGSSCPENPFVDVEPEGPSTECLGTTLTANLTSGTGPFAYQWTRDGLPISGATGATYTPDENGTFDYNCEVRADACPDTVTDGRDTRLTTVDAPFFDGVESAFDPQTQACSITMAWSTASTVCDGPVRYYVYRDTSPSVSPTPENLIASGLDATTFTDPGGLVNLSTYYYLVRALDQSTGQQDDNVAEVSSAPTGPGTGIFTVLSNDFEDLDEFALWTSGIQPGSRTCGEFARNNSSLYLPSGGSGFFVVSNAVPCTQKYSSWIDSPSMNFNISGIQSVTLDVDVYYNYLDGGDEATVEVWDGSAWQVVWSNPAADFNGHLTLDVTAQANGNANFRVRFFTDDPDQWFSFDNVVVMVDILNPCDTSFGPAPAPGGGGGTAPMLGTRATAGGDVIDVTWDTGSCTAADYNLVYGDLADVASTTLSGSACSLGTSGSFSWSGVPAGNLFFLVVGTDGAGTESSWGRDSLLGERNGVTPSGLCGTVAKDVSGTCP